MLCALTGLPAKTPVISPKGIIFDLEEIKKLIKTDATCPFTGTPLAESDLIHIQLSRPDTVPPRHLGHTIPSQLNTFDSEYSSLILEQAATRGELTMTLEELSKAMYEGEASTRVIARLLKERDTAKMELEKLKANMGGEVAETVEALTGLDAETKLKITNKSQELSSERRTRIPSPHLVSAGALKAYRQLSSHAHHKAGNPGLLAVDIHLTQQNLAVTAGVDKSAIVFDWKESRKISTLTAHTKRVTSCLFHPVEEAIFTASADSQIRIWTASASHTNYKSVHEITIHKDEVTRLSLHPTMDFLVSASRDSTWAFHDVKAGVTLLRIPDVEKSPLTTVMLHPDGVILATGTENYLVRIWDLKSQKNVANFTGHKGEITDVCFSENGYYFATSSKDNSLKLWDLRGTSKNIATLQLDTAVRRLNFDYSGKYLAAATGNEIRIFTGKQLEHVHTFDEHVGIVTDVKFGNHAQFLISTSLDRTSKVWG